MNPVPPCPECAGPWLNGWRWQHDVTTCPLLPQLDATQAADVERLRSRLATFQRPPTPAEVRLWTHVVGSPPQSSTTVLPLTDHIPAVCIAGCGSAAEATP